MVWAKNEKKLKLLTTVVWRVLSAAAAAAEPETHNMAPAGTTSRSCRQQFSKQSSLNKNTQQKCTTQEASRHSMQS